MALNTNAYTTYTAATAGNIREDLSDIIHDISPTETPFLTSIGKNSATNTKHEWIKESLASASSSNFVLEGDDATVDAASAGTRVINYCAISDKVPSVTGTNDAVDAAGSITHMAHQMEKRMKELKRDVESALLENNAYVAGDATNARECAGLQAYVKTNTDIASDASASAGTGADAHTDGTARALTESMVETVLASAWTNGGMPSMGILNAFQKRKFATFSGNATSYEKAEDKKITNSVDVYIDPLGSEVRLVPDRFVPADVVFFVDPEYAKFSVLRDFRSWDLAKVGDTIRKQILVEYTLEVCTEAAHAGIYDLTTS